MVELPYGRVPYLLDLGPHRSLIVSAPELSSPPPLSSLLDAALSSPLGRPLHQLVRAGAKVTVIISDATRTEPRAAFLEHLRAHLPSVSWTIAIATGTHGPGPLDSLALPSHLLRDARLVNHDGHAEIDLVSLGTTDRGTPVRLHRCLLDADLVIATGCIRPHYFAGFGAGAKSIFPGLGFAPDIRRNHALNTHPRTRAGILVDNPCRDDIEQAVSFLPTPTFLLNGLCGPDDRLHGAIAGDLRLAFHAGVDLLRPWFTVRAPRSSLVIASDALPVTASLYQAAKIAAAVAPLVTPHGHLVLAAECPSGTGPLDVVNEAIFRIGVLPRLAPHARLSLVSSLSPEEVSRTLLDPAPAIEPLLHDADPIVIVPRASRLILELSS